MPETPSSTPAPNALPVVVHFVTGGFSGATHVAADLSRPGAAHQGFRPVLVLRRKSNTSNEKLAALRAQGIEVMTVAGWSHWHTIWQLSKLLKSLKAEVLLAHGFPEHLIGRRAGLLAKVPTLIQVEHNSKERYSLVSRWQVRRLAPNTAHFIGVSEGVKSVLLNMGLPPERTLAFANGVNLSRFAQADEHPFGSRIPGLVMAARFARQKDHLCLLEAVAQLKQRGLTPPVVLAGLGKRRYLEAARQRCQSLGLENQVQFAGSVRDLPSLLMNHQIGVLASHYEGLPLAMLEYMAAGMAVVASDVIGIREIIRPHQTGILVPESDASALADALQSLLIDSTRAEQIALAGQAQVHAEHDDRQVARRYADLIRSHLPA